MDKEKIERINFLARKQKAEGLTDEEKSEQAILRREYIDAYKQSLISQLESTYYLDEQGNKHKLSDKKKPLS